MKYPLLSLYCCFVLLGCATLKNKEPRSRDLAKIKESPVSYYEAAVPLLNSDYPEQGVEKLKEILSVHENFPLALQALGNYYSKKREYGSALNYFHKLKKENEALLQDSYELYATALAGNGQFTLAKKYLDSFFLRNPDLKKLDPTYYQNYQKMATNFSFAIEYGKQLKTFMTVKDLHIQNIGGGINTKDMEYTPSLSLNGKRIIFTRRRPYGDENLYESEKINDTFSPSIPITDLNTPMNEGSASLSSDGKKLLITYCDREDGYGKCDIYIAYYSTEKKKWTPPINLGDKVNTKDWESQPQFGPNNNSIYFSSDRLGGKGGKDIWVSYINEDGEWQDPINLGNHINTPYDEELPFMHYDNETIYFSSNGWQGYGSSDLFLAKRISDAEWETPINMGFPINTIDKEGGLIIEFDAKYGYFSSDKSDGNSKGSTDIYKYEIPEQFRPRISTWINGKVINAKTSQDVKADVFITNLRTNKPIGKVSTSKDGYFLITLPIGEEYAFNISKNGYFLYSQHLDIKNDSIQEPIIATFALHPLEIGLVSTLQNIFFDTDNADIKATSFPELDKLVDLMNENNHMEISVNGHTDNIGKEAYNVDLSLRRAKAIKKYLVTHGISTQRISTKGLGSSQPIKDNTTEENRRTNRRSDIVITKL